jgi:hypothetical protein
VYEFVRLVVAAQARHAEHVVACRDVEEHAAQRQRQPRARRRGVAADSVTCSDAGHTAHNVRRDAEPGVQVELQFATPGRVIQQRRAFVLPIPVTGHAAPVEAGELCQFAEAEAQARTQQFQRARSLRVVPASEDSRHGMYAAARTLRLRLGVRGQRPRQHNGCARERTAGSAPC